MRWMAQRQENARWFCKGNEKKFVLRELKDFGRSIMKRMICLGKVCSPRLAS